MQSGKFVLALFLTLLCFFLLSCSVSRKATDNSIESFDLFYTRFHQDSVFQMQRLAEPMGGYKIEGVNIRNWRDIDWVLHKKGKGEIDESVYEIEREMKQEEIREKISIPNSSFLIERTFEIRNGQWFLTYCLEIFL